MNALFAMIFLKVWKQNTMDECRNLFLPRSLGQILTFASVNAYALSSHNVISLPYSFMGQTFYSIVRVTLQNIRIPLLFIHYVIFVYHRYFFFRLSKTQRFLYLPAFHFC